MDDHDETISDGDLSIETDDISISNQSSSSEPLVAAAVRGRGRGRGRGRPRGGVRGQGGRGRGRGRGRPNTNMEDQERIKELQEARKSEMRAQLSALTSDQRDQLLEKVTLRLPGLMFDVLAFFEPDPNPETPNHPLPWCMCTNCKEMPTDLERKCCRQRPENCISRLAHMNFYVLDEGVLRLARAAWNDIFAIDDDQEPGVEQRQYRHTAYRQFILWQYGRLGEGNRVVIPSCAVWRIRDTFPDPQAHYTGFIPRRLN